MCMCGGGGCGVRVSVCVEEGGLHLRYKYNQSIKHICVWCMHEMFVCVCAITTKQFCGLAG